jgi:hypothetical protein
MTPYISDLYAVGVVPFAEIGILGRVGFIWLLEDEFGFLPVNLRWLCCISKMSSNTHLYLLVWNSEEREMIWKCEFGSHLH